MRELTDGEQNRRVLVRAGELSALGPDELVEREATVIAPGEVVGGDPVEIEALRCARSRHALVAALDGHEGPPARLSVVWAMYGESGRIRPPGPDNPHGEDFLRAKVAQVDWLTSGLPIEWRLVAVDDGCPHEPSSAEVAAEISRAEGWHRPPSDRPPPDQPGAVSDPTAAPVTVVRLADAIGAAPDRIPGPGFARINSTSDSRKGGSILYGMWLATGAAPAKKATTQAASRRTGREDDDDAHRDQDGGGADRRSTGGPENGTGATGRHVVIYTDADLSANLAQAGLLAGPILEGRAHAVAGQRYGVSGAVLVKERGPSVEPFSTGNKPDKAIILFRHFVRAGLVPDLASVLDTQAGFKAFDAAELGPVLVDMTSFDETFDVELLIRFSQRRSAATRPDGPGLAVAPIVFVEDFAATNFPSVDPGQRHLDMVHQLVAVYDELVAPHRPATGEVAELLSLCRELDLDRYVSLIERIRTLDETRAAAGGPDPLFDARWSIEELTATD